MRGGLLRVVESLAAHQSARRPVAVASPIPPRAPAGVRWIPLELAGNSRLLAHLRLSAVAARLAADVAFVHAGSPGEGALAAALLARRRPTVLLEHLPEHFPLQRRGRVLVYRALKRRATVWACVSDAGARHLEASWRLPAGSLATIHCGVDAPTVRGSGRGRPAVVAFGRPERRKGYDVFEAVARALAAESPQVRWLWVGADRASRSGPVELVPWQDSVGEYLDSADLVLIPSRAEGLPLLLLEAWSLGRAVIASRVGGLPEVVEDDRNGVLVAAADVPAWIAAVRRLLGDGAARTALGERGRQTWRERFTAAAMAARFEAVIAALPGAGGGR